MKSSEATMQWIGQAKRSIRLKACGNAAIRSSSTIYIVTSRLVGAEII